MTIEFMEVDKIITEATRSVEDAFSLEDAGWINFNTTGQTISSTERLSNLYLSRLYAAKDPMGKQAIRLWTDYTFGGGMTWQTEDEAVSKVLEGFWGSKVNQSVLSARGQRLSSKKLLIDGEVFFAIFLGAGAATIRRIDPAQITEIITGEDDIEDVRFYKREWANAQGQGKMSIYRSISNIKGEPAVDAMGHSVTQTEDALVYHFAYNTIEQRGNPLLLPALDWIKQYRRFLASRIAIMLALAKFAWRSKVKGGQTTVDSIKGKLNEVNPNAGSVLVENMGVDTQPIKTDTGASNAYQDGRMLKLQVCSAVGISEQYFGDVSVGSLATAKTVELPMMKMFQSYQKVWSDVYQDIDEVILEHAGIAPDKWVIDRDFPPITPTDAIAVADAISKLALVMPGLADSRDVQQMALMALGINNTADVLDAMNEEMPESKRGDILKAVRDLREAIAGGL